MNIPCKITVIRHGETAWNRQGRMQGHLDCSINVFSIAGDDWILEAWGISSHLQALDTLDDY